jgi:hypothetical protein
MKTTRLAPVFIIVLLAALPLMASFPNTVTVQEVRLEKVGEATFKWMVFKVYEGALYLERGADPRDPLADISKSLQLTYSRGLTAEQFVKSGDAFLRKNTTPDEWDALADRLARLNAAYRDVEKGDTYALSYTPDGGTTLALNGRPLVTIEGADFARAYFSIWLGDNPTKAKFKEALLSRR